jgi:UDP-N-acetylglucosamine 2-epimerase (non-hydrolysing)
LKILTVVGARPNFMKAASIMAAIRRYNNQSERSIAAVPIEHVLVHTGQHYDALMSGSFFEDLNMPAPDVMLGVGSGSHVFQTAEISKKFEAVLLDQQPDVVVVVGDVNSTLACALTTAKIAFDSAGARPLLAHVESGLRSFDRLMPEEINRTVTDRLSDLLFVTEESAIRNLLNEGIPSQAIHFVGNTMIDSLIAFKDRAEASTVLSRLRLRSPRKSGDHQDGIMRYALLTLHRPSNVDNLEIFVSILAGLKELAAEMPVVFPVHPRTQQRISKFCLEPGKFRMSKEPAQGSSECHTGIILTEPLSYLDFLCLMKHSAVVVTDSGGIQEETTCLGVPCVTVRDNTERPVTIETGTNILAGAGEDTIAAAIRQQLEKSHRPRMPKHWDGLAGRRIIDILITAHRERTSSLPRMAAPACV